MKSALRETPAALEEDAGRSRHGQWRLLLPALLSWASAAALIHRPGSGRALALAAALAGAVCCVLLLTARARAAPQPPTEVQHPRDSAARPGRPQRRTRRPVGRKLAICAFLLVCCAAQLALGGRVEWLERSRDTPDLADAAGSGKAVSAAVKLAGYPQATAGFGGEERSWVRGRLTLVAGKLLPTPVPAILWLPVAPDERWHPGAQIAVQGTLDRGPPESLVAYEVRVTAQEYVGPAGGIGRWFGPAAADMRATLRAAAAQHTGAALVPGLAVGDTSLVSDELDRLMLDSNLTHLTAVSGSNCALVITAMTAVAKRVGLGRRMRVLLGAAALSGFVTVVGPDASVQRAALMAGVLLVSRYGGKQRQALPALGLATFVLLIADPWQAIQPGFALSVTATAGILLWATPLQSWIQTRLRLPVILALPLAVAAVAQFACAPLLLLLQPGISIGGVLANLLAAPAAPLGTGLGMLALLALPLSRALGDVGLVLGTYPARWIEAAGTVGAGLPAGRWYWPGGWGGLLLLAGVYLLLGVAWAIGSGWSGIRRPVRSSPGGPALFVRAAAGIAAGVAVAVTLVVPGGVRLGVPNDWAVVACDVGQGDALLVRDPARPAEVMLVDTGDDPDSLNACLGLFGVRRISLLVLTHNHRDHVGALAEAVGRSDAVMIAPPSAEDAGREPLAARVAKSGLPVVTGESGLPVVTGESGLSGGRPGSLRWEVLAPAPGRTHATANATSLVLLVDVAGARILLLGDTGETEQRELARRYPGLTADVVKVAHHGSRDQAPGVYSELGARIGLISVGEGNRYGHPSAPLLADLAASGTLALRTDELGSVAIRLTPTGLEPWSAGERTASAGPPPVTQRNSRPRRIRSYRDPPGPGCRTDGCVPRSRGTPRRRRRCRSRSSCR